MKPALTLRARKRTVNLTRNGDLVSQAKSYSLDSQLRRTIAKPAHAHL